MLLNHIIEYCIQHNILKEFLSKQKAEIIKMSIFEYEEERENTIKSIISFGKKLGASKEQIIKELQERCLLEEQEAEKKVTLHWNE